MPNADESEHIQEMRKALMEMELDRLKTFVLAEVKEEQPDAELPSGGKEEIVAWAIEWVKAWEAEKEAKAREAEEEKKRAEADAREEARLLIESSLTSS